VAGDDAARTTGPWRGPEARWGDHAPGWWGPRPARRGRLAWRVALAAVVVLVLAGVVAAKWVLPYYAITPGTALNVAQLISVPRGASHRHRGSVVLTDVQLVQLTALGYLYYRFDEHAEIVSSADLTGGASSSAYDEEGVIEMATARQAAVLVALRELGYHPRAVPDGAVVFAVEPGAKTASTLAVGDVVTAAGSAPTPVLSRLAATVGAASPGSSLRIAFHGFASTRLRHRTVVVGELESSGSASKVSFTCDPAGSTRGRIVRRDGRPTGCLPVYAEQLYANEDEPFPVSINSGGIVGPSAGLSFTLGVIEKLDRGDLTGERRVAATGTMANDGSVGAIGGIAQKTIAVRAAGATVFLVPPANAAVARANAGPDLRIIAVSSIGEAVAALEHLGGRLVRATAAR